MQLPVANVSERVPLSRDAAAGECCCNHQPRRKRRTRWKAVGVPASSRQRRKLAARPRSLQAFIGLCGLVCVWGGGGGGGRTLCVLGGKDGVCKHVRTSLPHRTDGAQPSSQPRPATAALQAVPNPQQGPQLIRSAAAHGCRGRWRGAWDCHNLGRTSARALPDRITNLSSSTFWLLIMLTQMDP